MRGFNTELVFSEIQPAYMRPPLMKNLSLNQMEHVIIHNAYQIEEEGRHGFRADHSVESFAFNAEIAILVHVIDELALW